MVKSYYYDDAPGCQNVVIVLHILLLLNGACFY